MKKYFLVSILTGFWLIVLGGNLFADESPAPVVNTSDNGSVSEKLDRVISTQEEILKQLDEIKSELEVVKVRASQR